MSNQLSDFEKLSVAYYDLLAVIDWTWIGGRRDGTPSFGRISGSKADVRAGRGGPMPYPLRLAQSRGRILARGEYRNALPCLLALLGSPKKGIRKEACWTISNITAGNKDQIHAVIDNNIVPPLIQLLAHAEFDIRKEAAWAISNATSGGNAEQIKFLVQQGCIRPLCDLLTVNDSKIVTIALEALENILKVGEADAKESGTHNQMATLIAEAEGLTKIEDLQAHNNNEIYQKSINMLENYFGVEDEEEMPALAPQMVDGGSTFAFAPPTADPMGGAQFDFSSAGGNGV